MDLPNVIAYRAIAARDARFDGVFFVGVKTTGIYCRPVCTAKTPKLSSCQFYPTAALAEQAGFRPCLRCRPELAPGQSSVDGVRTAARAAAARIEAGALNDGGGLEQLAASLSLSSRQLRRAVRAEFGVSPVELAQTHRLLLAKRLIAETALSMTQIAYAAGFASVRRFNAVFRCNYRLTPSELRRTEARDETSGTLRLTLAYRPPHDWASTTTFLAARAVLGVECVTSDEYRRTVQIGRHCGVLKVADAPPKHAVVVELSAELVPALPSLLAKLRHLFDLDARPDVIDQHLSVDPRLRSCVRRRPGLRVPGAFDSFELATRAVLGQQVTVRGASTLAGRLAQRFGGALKTTSKCLNRLSPTAQDLAAARSSALTDLGLTSARAETLRRLARAVADGAIDLEPGADPILTVAKLLEIPGIGDWTAQYIAMRALHWPDAFPAGDLGLLKASGAVSPRELERKAERWRPWRAYAALQLWNGLGKSSRRKPASTQE
ncbi:MAG: AlkA N-terminal domain-containing protein [Pirellulales bacterium]